MHDAGDVDDGLAPVGNAGELIWVGDVARAPLNACRPFTRGLVSLAREQPHLMTPIEQTWK